jgi:hypothetical protein
MPRRPDSIEAYWLDIHGGFSGHPTTAATRKKATREAKPTLRAAIEGMAARGAFGESPEFAVIEVRDKVGFAFERVVGLDDYVSQREAAMILDLPLMTINRAVRARRLPSHTRRGYSVILLREVLNEAKRRGLALKQRRRLVVLGARGSHVLGLDT